MLYLLATILTAAAIMVLFKVFIRYDIDHFQAILINYVFAIAMGFISSPVDFSSAGDGALRWLPAAIVLGVLFFTTMLLFAASTQAAGVAITTISSRTSLIIPVAASFLLFGEKPTTLKIIAIAMVLGALVLIFMQGKKSDENQTLTSKKVLIPMAVFLSTALIDTIIKAAQFFLIENSNQYSIFVSTIFCVSLIFGTSFLLITRRLKGSKFALRNIIGGLALGFVNFYTNYSLLNALNVMDATTVYPIMYTGIVLLTTITGVYIFSEKLTTRKIIGITIAVAAIVLLTI